jgi:hypothetical protein
MLGATAPSSAKASEVNAHQSHCLVIFVGTLENVASGGVSNSLLKNTVQLQLYLDCGSVSV